MLKQITKSLLLIALVVGQLAVAAPRKGSLEIKADRETIVKELEAKGIDLSKGALNKLTTESKNKVLDILAAGKFGNNLIESAKTNMDLAISMLSYIKIQKFVEEINRAQDATAEQKAKASELSLVLEAQRKMMEQLVELENTRDEAGNTPKDIETIKKIVEILPKMSDWTTAELKSWADVLVEVTSKGGDFGNNLVRELQKRGLTLEDILKCKV